MELFTKAAEVAKSHITEWLPDGHVERGNEWVCPSPTHSDKNIGNFSVNLDTGAFNDYADPDFRGRDAVSLYAQLNGLTNYQAAKDILEKYDPFYFPSANDHISPKYEWRQLTRGHKNAPELPTKYHGEKHWPLETKVGDSWRVSMWITRYRFDGEKNTDGKDKKVDCPYTLWSDGKNLEWRKGALKKTLYPLYGLRHLIEHPNKRIVLYEGQKPASIMQEVLGDDWNVVGWYGGAGNTKLTDFTPLTGGEVWYPFDSDMAGRRAISSIVEKVHAKLHLVYPPIGMPKGWDHADAVKQGYTKEQIEELLLADYTDAPEDKQITCVTENGDIVPDNRPTMLDSEISDDLREDIMSEITIESTDKNGDPIKKIRVNWMMLLPMIDPAIKNSIKFDYTTGIEATAYDNRNLYVAALENRLERIGVPANFVTSKVVDKMERVVVSHNSNFNRVVDYMDALCGKFPDVDASILDKFMSFIEFRIPINEGEDDAEYEERCQKCVALYKELFDKFFLRMHAHIEGTRRINGIYKGLLANDIVPILTGPQGCGKTTLCQWMACDSELYADLGSGLKTAFGSAETVKKVRGKMLAEIGEMKVMKNPDTVETIKSFISQKSVDVDIKYVENQRQIPMTTSYIGTSNPEEYLSDDTGNRRFWPVKIQSVDMDGLEEDSDDKYKLHAYYSKKAKSMSLKEVFEYCKPSEELAEFMDSQRQEALITYSDYEACCAVIKGWMENLNNVGQQLNQASVERLAYKSDFNMRISRRSVNRALADCGMTQKRVKSHITGKPQLAWVYEKTDEIPF